MTDYETPIMRDIRKLTWQILLGLLGAVVVIFLFVFPYHMSVIGPHCIETTDYSIPQWIFREFTIKC